INVGALREFADQVAAKPAAKPAAGIATFGVVTTWEGGTRTRARTMPLVLGNTALARGFAIDADEPAEKFFRRPVSGPP
ncbi:MAG: OsmC family peroxiredoxin, partial [Pseudomonadota bacterium]|nr:OsmC family peroxiredoxin [Pseudomonadota bacterium]